MGGPGFCGLLIEDTHYLVYAVWCAAQYTLFNGKPVHCHPALYHRCRPWHSAFAGHTWDDLSPLLIGSTIFDTQLETERLTLSLQNGRTTHNLAFVRYDKALPHHRGRKRNAYKKGEISDYLLWQHPQATLIV